MFDNILNLFKKKNKEEVDKINKEKAKERLHLVLMQDRANVSADFLDLMKQEIIDVIKKYIDVDEDKIDVKLTNKLNGDGTTGAPALYANIPIKNIKKETRINSNKDVKKLEELGKEKIVTTGENANSKPTPEVKAEPKKEDHSIVIDVPESKAGSAAFTNNIEKTPTVKAQVVNAQPKKAVATTSTTATAASSTATVANSTATAASSTATAASSTATVAKNTTTAVNMKTRNAVPSNPTPVSSTPTNPVTDKNTVVVTNTTQTVNKATSAESAIKNEKSATVEKKVESDNKNDKTGKNEKVEEKNENKPVKMNAKKTTFFENVPHKKK